MRWFVLNSGAGGAAFNMALDEALPVLASQFGKPVLRFYCWTEPAATFGYFQKYSEVEQATPLRPLIRRSTGGGIVPHDADWTYSFAVPPNHEWYSLAAIESYHQIHAWIQSAFARLKIETEIASCCRKPKVENRNAEIPAACFIGYEKFDLLWHGKKIAGAAQRRSKSGLLVQGSVQTPVPLSRNDWQQAMVETAREKFSVDWTELKPDEGFNARVQSLVTGKYSHDGFNRKR